MMTKRRGAAILGAVWLMQSGTAQGPTFRSRTDLVTVDVAVTQRGAPVVGLQIGDFELTDNGVAQRVELLDGATLELWEVHPLTGERTRFAPEQVVTVDATGNF